MKQTLRMVAAAIAVLAATTAFSAAAQERSRPQIGLGIGIVPLEGAGILPTIEVYLPIQIAPQIRIEPSLGVFTNDRPDPNPDTRDITLGIGGFFMQSLAPNVDMYAGGRLKLNFAKVSTPVASDSGTDVIVAAALGGEYYFVPRFSIGLEGQLGLYSNSAVSGDDSGFFTTGLAFLRVYFK